MGKDILKEEAFSKEAYVAGILWSNPELYSYYQEDKLGIDKIGNAVWKFFIGLGRHMYKNGIIVFDDISVSQAVNDLSLQDKYKKYGGFETIDEMRNEVKGSEENIEGYYQEVKKYSLLRDLYNLFGDKVIKNSGKYDYKKMNAEQLANFWNDKVNSATLNNSDVKNEEFDLLEDLEEYIEELDKEPDTGMAYYRSKKLTDITNGWAFGTVTLLSAFSGNGKSSFVLEKIVMQCVHEQEKLLILANEMDVAQYRKYLLVTVMGGELYEKFRDMFGKGKETFNRKNLNKGNFTDEEKEKLITAVKWVRDVTKGNGDLIKFIAMSEYTMDNVESTIRHYARRGYKRVIVDTAKPSEGNGNEARWETFVKDFDTLYKLARANGGGLNLALMATIQNADTALNMRYLDERCIGDGKKIKNVSDVVFHMRPAWADEFEGEKNELKVTQWIPPSESMNGEPEKVTKKLKDGKVYYLLFTSKNRRGMSNLVGLDVLVYEVNFNSNRWKEVGYAKVQRDMM